MAPTIISSTVSAISSCRNSSRSAEQRWPALMKAELTTSSTTCSGSAVESTSIAFKPPVSAISGTMAPPRAASARLMVSAVAVDPVMATPARAGCANAISPNSRPGAGIRCSASGATPASCRSPDEARGNQRRRLGGLGHDAIAGGQRRGHLSREDRQRKIPRADAGKHAAPVQRQLVRLAGRPLEARGVRELFARAHRVVTAEIHRLAHFGDRIRQRLSGFADQQFVKVQPALSRADAAVRSRQSARAAPPSAFHAACAPLPASNACRDFRRRRVARTTDARRGGRPDS